MRLSNFATFKVLVLKSRGKRKLKWVLSNRRMTPTVVTWPRLSRTNLTTQRHYMYRCAHITMDL